MRIRTRFSILIIFLFSAIAGASLWYENILVREHLVLSQENWLNTLNRAIAEAVANDVINEDRSHAKYLLEAIATDDMAVEYIYVTDFDQRLFAHTFENGFPRMLVSSILEKNNPHPYHFQAGGKEIVQYSTPLIEGMDAYLHIGVNQDEIDAIVSKSFYDKIPIYTILIVISLMLALYISSRISEPLQSLSKQIRRYSKTSKLGKLNTDISEPDVRGLAKAFNDMIATRIKIENQLQIATSKAEEANIAKSRFLASVSHELRTPLNAILGFSEVMKLGLLGPVGTSKYQEYVEDIYDSAEHLHSLINDLLDLSTIEAGKLKLNKEMLLVDDICKDCFKILADQAQQAKINMELTLAANVPEICADKRAIKQILLNLLQNSIKFTPDGGKISISTSTFKEGVSITIQDSGIGMSEDILKKLTTPFTKADDTPLRASKGWGLGLAICQSLVDLHGGKMVFLSKPGQGTTVTIEMPLDLQTPLN